MNRRLKWLAACGIAWLLTLAAPSSDAYVLSGERWPAKQPIVMNLSLGKPGAALLDGSTSWDHVAETALAIWNPYLGSGVQFEGKETTAAPGHDDRVNQVFFDSTIYGEDFGEDVLAITISSFDTNTKIKLEADVVVNSATPYNSYRGNLRESSKGGTLFDLRRVLLHEFGHALGLNHVAQTTVSIMTPITSDIDTIQADDIAGVEAIYGKPDAPPEITGTLTVMGTVGQAFAYSITAKNVPTSFGASGLPDGLKIDTATGIISGTPTTAGTYHITITATNANGTDTATLVLTLANAPLIDSPLTVTALVNQPFAYRLTATGNPTSRSVGGMPAGLSFDAGTGLITGTLTLTGVFPVLVAAQNDAGSDHETLTIRVLFDDAAIPIYDFTGKTDGGQPTAPLIRTDDGSFYGTGNGGTVFQLKPDGTVGVLVAPVNSPGEGRTTGLLAAGDGFLYGAVERSRTVGGYVFRVAPDSFLGIVHSFSITEPSTPETALIQASDGYLYGTTSMAANGAGSGSVFKIGPDGSLTTVHVFNGTDGTTPSALVQASDGNLYGTTANSGARGGGGTFYRLTLDGTLTTLYNFDPNVGHDSTALIQAADGNLYGALRYGHAQSPGLLYRITTGGAFSVVHQFTAAEGLLPTELIQAKDGNFYGVTTAGNGTSTNAGSLFRVTPGGALTKIHTFGDADGNPQAGLVEGTDGEFYGTTFGGGINAAGTIFKTTINTPVVPPPVVSVVATTPKVTLGSGVAGVVTISLSAAQSVPVVVYYTVKGSAENGKDYVYLKGKKKIKPGKTSKPLNVIPLGDLGGAPTKKVKIVLQPDPNYTVGTPLPAKVKILAR